MEWDKDRDCNRIGLLIESIQWCVWVSVFWVSSRSHVWVCIPMYNLWLDFCVSLCYHRAEVSCCTPHLYITIILYPIRLTTNMRVFCMWLDSSIRWGSFHCIHNHTHTDTHLYRNIHTQTPTLRTLYFVCVFSKACHFISIYFQLRSANTRWCEISHLCFVCCVWSLLPALSNIQCSRCGRGTVTSCCFGWLVFFCFFVCAGKNGTLHTCLL